MKKLISGIVLIGLAFAAASCVKMDINNLFSSTHEADFDIIGTYESIGYVQPAAYQEIAFWLQKTDKVEYSTVLTISEDRMVFTFPGGGYRELGYVMDKENKTITFDHPLVYKSIHYDRDYAEDVLKCSYRLESSDVNGSTCYNIVFYRSGANIRKMDINKGDWRINFQLEPSPKHGSKPVFPIEGEFGTVLSPMDMKLPSGKLWAAEPVCGGKTFEKPSVDVAAAYYGPTYEMPGRADGEELVSSTNIKFVEYTHGTFVAFAESSYNSFVAIPVPENMQTGFWLSDGSAVLCEVDPRTYKVSTRVDIPEQGALLQVVPVVK